MVLILPSTKEGYIFWTHLVMNMIWKKIEIFFLCFLAFEVFYNVLKVFFSKVFFGGHNLDYLSKH